MNNGRIKSFRLFRFICSYLLGLNSPNVLFLHDLSLKNCGFKVEILLSEIAKTVVEFHHEFFILSTHLLNADEHLEENRGIKSL